MKTNPNRLRPASRHYQSEQAYLLGVPQILDEAHEAMRRGFALTDDLERRNAEAIRAAKKEIAERHFADMQGSGYEPMNEETDE